MREERDGITITDEIVVRKIGSIGGDHMVVAAAKVSTSGEESERFADPSAADSNSGLIRFLMEKRHGTPFEHGAMTVFVHAPIFVWREWHRHRIGFSYNEESGRYKKLDPVFWVPRPDRKLVPVPGYKPSAPQFQAGEPRDVRFVGGSLAVAYRKSYDTYSELMAAGFAKEVCRACLPLGIYSSCWVTCNPRSLMSFLSLRVHEPNARFPSYPQAEIEQAARVAESFLAEGWPITHAAFVANGRVAP